MLLYHCTTTTTVAEIQHDGFREGHAGGVQFASMPLAPDDPDAEWAILAVELVGQDADSLARFAWEDPDHRATHQEWIIPAAFVNARAIIVHVDLPPLSLAWTEQTV